MEPIFTETASETVTAKLAAQLDAAATALPPTTALTQLKMSPPSQKKPHS